MRCPKCQKNTNLTIDALVTVELSFDADGELEGSEPVDANHEWEDASTARCGACGWAGRVADLHAADSDLTEELAAELGLVLLTDPQSDIPPTLVSLKRRCPICEIDGGGPEVRLDHVPTVVVGSGFEALVARHHGRDYIGDAPSWGECIDYLNYRACNGLPYQPTEAELPEPFQE
jgi:hypothetical protein